MISGKFRWRFVNRSRRRKRGGGGVFSIGDRKKVPPGPVPARTLTHTQRQKVTASTPSAWSSFLLLSEQLQIVTKIFSQTFLKTATNLWAWLWHVRVAWLTELKERRLSTSMTARNVHSTTEYWENSRPEYYRQNCRVRRKTKFLTKNGRAREGKLFGIAIEGKHRCCSQHAFRFSSTLSLWNLLTFRHPNSPVLHKDPYNSVTGLCTMHNNRENFKNISAFSCR